MVDRVFLKMSPAELTTANGSKLQYLAHIYTIYVKVNFFHIFSKRMYLLNLITPAPPLYVNFVPLRQLLLHK